MMRKDEAVLFDDFGFLVGMVPTREPAGACHYYYDTTIDGTPVNVSTGRLSRSKKALAAARMTGRFYSDCTIIAG